MERDGAGLGSRRAGWACAGRAAGRARSAQAGVRGARGRGAGRARVGGERA